MSTESGPSAGDYISHHLTHLQNKTPASVLDFSVFNMDTIFWSVSLGVLGCFLMWLAARRATSGIPGRFQAAVELPEFQQVARLAARPVVEDADFLAVELHVHGLAGSAIHSAAGPAFGDSLAAWE